MCCGCGCCDNPHGLMTPYLAADATWIWIQGFRAFFGAIWDGGWWNAFVAVIVFAGCAPPFLLAIRGHTAREQPRTKINVAKFYLIYAFKNFLLSVFSFLWMLVVFGWRWPAAGLVWLVSVPLFVYGTVLAYRCSGASFRMAQQAQADVSDQPKFNQGSGLDVSNEFTPNTINNNSTIGGAAAPVAVVSAQPALLPPNHMLPASSLFSLTSRSNTARSQIEAKPNRMTQQPNSGGQLETLDVNRAPTAHYLSNASLNSTTSSYMPTSPTPVSTLSTRDVLSVTTTPNARASNNRYNKHRRSPAPPVTRQRSRNKHKHRTLDINQIGNGSAGAGILASPVSDAEKTTTETLDVNEAAATAQAMAVYGVVTDDETYEAINNDNDNSPTYASVHRTAKHRMVQYKQQQNVINSNGTLYTGTDELSIEREPTDLSSADEPEYSVDDDLDDIQELDETQNEHVVEKPTATKLGRRQMAAAALGHQVVCEKL